jgi:hypothetical protein
MPFNGSLKVPIIGFVVFLALCFIALGGILSGNHGLTTTSAKVIEVTKGIANTDSGFSSAYNTIRVQYEYRGEEYVEAIEESYDLGDINPGDKVNVSFDPKYPNAIVKTDAPAKEDPGMGHKVSGWEIFAILVLALPLSVGILFFMMFLHENGSKTSSRHRRTPRVQ